jgi:Streptomyces sporulation and cell division protein, SsgA
VSRNARGTIVSEYALLEVVDAEGRGAVLGAHLVYDQRDPFAMSMVFQTLRPVTWTFSRELLVSGMYEPIGDGDVHVWPCLSDTGEAVVFEFSSPDGGALVQAGLRECARFVTRMLDSVPHGREERYLDVDAAINELLGEPPSGATPQPEAPHLPPPVTDRCALVPARPRPPRPSVSPVLGRAARARHRSAPPVRRGWC